ncbi:hypothetical protein EBBID32_28480 [Sphingobium indicum BiD32]|uniref:Uncharacterized protein n=1 Tax=Sphingobium indicum BiD32 TaxID=1301087 RepID=N1MMP5_9SPHN|nr:hypothetical protein EBBID32_28480 [Sphingobium indicum BiD32]
MRISVAAPAARTKKGPPEGDPGKIGNIEIPIPPCPPEKTGSPDTNRQARAISV